MKIVFGLLTVTAGVAFLAAGVTVLASFNPRDLHTEGSPGGTIAFVVLGSIGVFGTLGGLFAIVSGLAMLPPGRARAITGFGILPFLLVAAAYNVRNTMYAPAEPAMQTSKNIGKPAVVGDVFPFSWQAREGAPALALRVPVAELWPGSDLRNLGESRLRVDLALGPRKADVKLTIYRDDKISAIDGWWVRPEADESSAWLWVAKKPGGWHLLGIDCRAGNAPAGLPDASDERAGCHTPGFFARRVPIVFGISRVRLRAANRAGGCRMNFPFHERPVGTHDPDRCFSEGSLATLKAAATRLENLARDSAVAR